MEESPNADKEFMVVFMSSPYSSVTFAVDEMHDDLLRGEGLITLYLLQNIKKFNTKLHSI